MISHETGLIQELMMGVETPLPKKNVPDGRQNSLESGGKRQREWGAVQRSFRKTVMIGQ